MASFGFLTSAIKSRAQKLKKFIGQEYAAVREGVQALSASAEAVISSTSKFLNSFGRETAQLSKISKERLAAQDTISQVSMREKMIAAIEAQSKTDIKNTIEKYARGRISPEMLKTELQSILKTGTLAVTAVGTLGIGNITENVITAAQRQLSDQFSALDGFINEVSTRELTQRDTQRFLQYAASLHSISQTANRQFNLDTYGDPSALEEIRELGSADHCDQCVALAALGWVPFGSLPAIGTDTWCGDNCHCTIKVRMKTENLEQSQPVPEANNGGLGA